MSGGRAAYETIRCPNCGMLSKVHFDVSDVLWGFCRKCQTSVVWRRPVDMATPIPELQTPKGAMIF